MNPTQCVRYTSLKLFKVNYLDRLLVRLAGRSVYSSMSSADGKAGFSL